MGQDDLVASTQREKKKKKKKKGPFLGDDNIYKFT